MMSSRIALAVYVVACQGCARSGDPSQPSAQPLTGSRAAVRTFSAARPREPAGRGYDNGVNQLTERQFEVTNNLGEPAVCGFERLPIGAADLKIVWTYTSQHGGNYCLPEFPGGKDAFEAKYPSTTFFLEKKLEARTILALKIPDTPYEFFILNGSMTLFFLDSQKIAIWQIRGAGLEKVIHTSGSISTSSKIMKLSAGGGDMAAFLVIDFSDRQASPKVKYYEEYYGP